MGQHRFCVGEHFVWGAVFWNSPSGQGSPQLGAGLHGLADFLDLIILFVWVRVLNLQSQLKI